MRWLTGSFFVALVALGCSADETDPSAKTQPAAGTHEAPLSRLSARLGRGEVRLLDVRPGRALVGLPAGVASETDQRPLYQAFLWDERTDVIAPLATEVRTARLEPTGALVVDAEGALLRVTASGTTRLSDRVLGTPALRPNGDVVVTRGGAEPGESDLFWLRSDGSVSALAPAPGPDDLPVSLPDGRIAFVSGRTTVASLWLVEPETGALRQLTNRGLAAGRPLTGFVPPPATAITVSDGVLSYDDGSGATWRVDLQSGAVRRTGEVP